jgi:hypothetical protein
LRAARLLLYAARMKLRSILIVVALAGCGKGDKKAAPDQTASGSSEASAAPAKKPLTADFFGKKVAPPGALASIAFGSSVDDAKKAAPQIFAKPSDAYFLVDDPAIDHVSYGVMIDKDTKKVSGLAVTVPGEAKAMLASAWGAGKDAKDSIDKPYTAWFDPAAGWRATAEPGFDPKDLKLDFHPYLPAAKLLGEGAESLGFAPQGILGATIADLRTRFGAALVEVNAQQAAAEQKKVGDFVGSDVSKDLGAAKPEARLSLPPTEWDEFETRVQINWTDDGKVDDVWFDLPYESYAPAKDELLALIKQKWGEPKDGEYLGDKALLFRDKPPFIAVVDDTIGHAWTVHVFATKPE